MSDIFGTLQTIMVDHVRLSLMSQIQQKQTVNIPQLICLAILVGLTSLLYETITGEEKRKIYNISLDWRTYFMYKHSVVFEGKHITSVEPFCRRPIILSNTFSKSFRAILFCILKNVENMKDIRELKEFATSVIKGEQREDKNADDIKTMFMVSQRAPFILNKEREIYFIVKEHGEQREEGNAINKNENRIIKINIHLFSYKTNVNGIKEFVKSMKAEYSKHLEETRRGKLFVYTLHNTEVNNDEEDDTIGGWRETQHETMKSLDNIFFEEKQEVIKKIKFFEENKEWYRHNGVPYTLGIALYGIPGTGKTSFIKAIATYLNRHIISISLSKIKTKKQLYDFYFETQYSTSNDKNAIGFDKKIIVFEDIDCIGDVILNRKSKSKKNDIGDNESIDEFIDASHDAKTPTENTPEDKVKNEIAKATKYVLKKMNCGDNFGQYASSNQNDNITLDDILNLWDGIRENTGRIMIITTNHYNKLDPALIRPGRIDISLNLGNATISTISEMYLHYYGTKIDPNDLALIPDRFYSPAEIINFYVSNHDNPVGFIERLVSAKKINIQTE
jgi:SpoVK/Ycf46/Vps4 family AAA+-type ATPase